MKMNQLYNAAQRLLKQYWLKEDSDESHGFIYMKSKNRELDYITSFRNHTWGVQLSRRAGKWWVGQGNDTSKDKGRGCDQGGVYRGHMGAISWLGGTFTVFTL